ncbi:MAG: phosphatidate cytidylyltransferase [Ruaniaceae bacterium]|nr:phosphatidate cytidylyltransferase [Ruaniaceae bacterium]
MTIEDHAPPASRAGRNLPAATATAAVLLLAVAASLAFNRVYFVALAIAACLLGIWELGRALSDKGFHVPLLPVWVGAVGILVNAWVLGPAGPAIALILTAATVFVWRTLDGGGPDAVRDAVAGIFVATYVPFMAAFAVLMAREEAGAFWIATFILLVVGNDTGGYAAGVLFGRHPIAPSISPKKSWEGIAGSFILTTAVAGVAMNLWLNAPLWWAPIVGVLIVFTATAGDFSESLLKRSLGLKDFGTILPGHGGMMDRLDSLLFTAPVAWLLFTLAAR